MWFSFKSFMVSGRSRCLSLDLDDFTLCRCKPQPTEGGICGPYREAHNRWGHSAPGGSDSVCGQRDSRLDRSHTAPPNPPPWAHLIPPDRKGHRCVEILPSVKHWFPIPKDLCFKVLNHMFHYFPETRQNLSKTSIKSGKGHTRMTFF